MLRVGAVLLKVSLTGHCNAAVVKSAINQQSIVLDCTGHSLQCNWKDTYRTGHYRQLRAANISCNTFAYMTSASVPGTPASYNGCWHSHG